MKTIILLSLVILFGNISLGNAQDNPQILLFTKTTGFRHDNIEKGTEVLNSMGQKHGFQLTHSEDAQLFTDDNLKKYQVIIFFSTTGDILDSLQKEVFVRFIQSGKGFVGIHAASDTEFDWPWYGKMVGGYFMHHPEVQHADIHVLNQAHEATKHLPKIWNRRDEWYDFKDLNLDTKILMKLDEKSYKGGKMGDHHPISWFHEYEGGRIFYTGLGHTKESFDEPDFLKHILGGINYALGIQK